MIDLISNWAGELVVSLVIVNLIEMLLPDNKIKKYVKTVIGVYIIFCIISPFIDKEEFWTVFEDTEKKLEQIQIDNQVAALKDDDSSIEKLYIQELKKDVIKKVEELGYETKKCEVEIEIDATKENAGINSIYLIMGDKKTDEDTANLKIESIPKVEISINNQEQVNNNETEDTEDTKKIKKFLSDYYDISNEKITIIQN